jgi:hypothetical protein
MKLAALQSSKNALNDSRQPALQGIEQVLGVQLKLLQLDFLNLFLRGKIGLLEQLFQPLSVAMMFGMQTIDFFAQRRVQDFIHRAPPFVNEQLHISPLEHNRQAQKKQKSLQPVEFGTEILLGVTAVTVRAVAALSFL